jgi:hypothetical protein
MAFRLRWVSARRARVGSGSSSLGRFAAKRSFMTVANASLATTARVRILDLAPALRADRRALMPVGVCEVGVEVLGRTGLPSLNRLVGLGPCRATTLQVLPNVVFEQAQALQLVAQLLVAERRELRSGIGGHVVLLLRGQGVGGESWAASF